MPKYQKNIELDQSESKGFRLVQMDIKVGGRGRSAVGLYKNTVEEFLATAKPGDKPFAVLDTGRKPLTLRQGLNQEIKDRDLGDKVLVSLIKDEDRLQKAIVKNELDLNAKDYPDGIVLLGYREFPPKPRKPRAKSGDTK